MIVNEECVVESNYGKFTLPFAVVLVTGGTGYIASHIIQQLQQDGQRVRVSVRSAEDEEKLKPIKELAPEAAHPLEIVEADLTKPDTWERLLSMMIFFKFQRAKKTACDSMGKCFGA